MNTDTPDGVWEGIETCPMHQAEADMSCQVCSDEMTARTARLEQMQAECAQRMKGLSQAGVGFPHAAADHIRLETLIDMILTGRSAFVFEGESGRRLIETLKSMQRDHITPAKPGLTVVRGNGGIPKEPRP